MISNPLSIFSPSLAWSDRKYRSVNHGIFLNDFYKLKLQHNLGIYQRIEDQKLSPYKTTLQKKTVHGVEDIEHADLGIYTFCNLVSAK